MNRGFTIIELLVSLAIFITMTTVIVAKFGNFNQSTLLTDTAYDIALTVHLAQSYGLSVKSSTQSGTPNFSLPYGVDFNKDSAACGATASSNLTTLVLFADMPDGSGVFDGKCSGTDVTISTHLMIRGASISSLCTGSDASHCDSVSRINISFLRPNPDANICGQGSLLSFPCNYAYAEVTISGADGSTRTIVLRQNGQISVKR